jgi:hypothetical protein
MHPAVDDRTSQCSEWRDAVCNTHHTVNRNERVREIAVRDSSAWHTILGRTAVCAPLPLVGILLSGCAIHHSINSELPNRLTKRKTVAISPPYVMGYIQPYDLGDTRQVSLPDIAASNLAAAVGEQFGRSEYFVARDLDLRQSAVAPATPPWSGAEGGYGPYLTPPEGMNFKPTAFKTPAPESSVDAALFTFAWEKTTTAGGIFKRNNPLVIWLKPIELAVDGFAGRPDSAFLRTVSRREICLGVCVIDNHTGDVLWSDIEFAYGTRKLEEPGTAAKLVAKAYRKFTKDFNAKPRK